MIYKISLQIKVTVTTKWFRRSNICDKTQMSNNKLYAHVQILQKISSKPDKENGIDFKSHSFVNNRKEKVY